MTVLPLDPGVPSSHAKSGGVDTQPEGSSLIERGAVDPNDSTLNPTVRKCPI